MISSTEGSKERNVQLIFLAAFMCAVTKIPVRKISISLHGFLTRLGQSPASPLASDLLLGANYKFCILNISFMVQINEF